MFLHAKNFLRNIFCCPPGQDDAITWKKILRRLRKSKILVMKDQLPCCDNNFHVKSEIYFLMKKNHLNKILSCNYININQMMERKISRPSKAGWISLNNQPLCNLELWNFFQGLLLIFIIWKLHFPHTCQVNLLIKNVLAYTWKFLS